MDMRGGSARPRGPPQYGGPQRPSGFNNRNNFQQHQGQNRMMNPNMQSQYYPQQPIPNHLLGGNNYQLQQDMQRMMQTNFNDTPTNIENYQNRSFYPTEMVAASSPPPAFSHYPPIVSPQPHPQGIYMPAATIPVNTIFTPNSPNDPNTNFAMLPAMTNPTNSIASFSSIASYNKLNQIVKCASCGHSNHLAGSEIGKLESENEELKEMNDKLRKELNELMLRMELQKREIAFNQIPLVQAANKTLLSPEAKEFVYGESKDTIKPEVPVVSAKAIEDEHFTEKQTEEVQPETGTNIVSEEPMQQEEIPKVENIESLNNENISDNVSQEHEGKVELQQNEMKIEPPESNFQNNEAQSLPVDAVEVAVDGVHTSCQTNEAFYWDSSEEHKSEPLSVSESYQPPAGGDQQQSQYRQNNYNQQHYGNREPQNRRFNDSRGRGRPRVPGDNSYNNDGRNQYNQQQRNEFGYGHQKRGDNRPFRGDSRQYPNEPHQSQNDFRGPRQDGPNFRENINRNYGRGRDQGNRQRPYNREGGNNQSTARGSTNNPPQHSQHPPTAETAVKSEEASAAEVPPLTDAKRQDYQTNGTGRKHYLPKNMVHEIKGDLFTVDKEYSLAHCVAKDFRMGSGIAVKFREEFKRVGELLDQDVDVGGCAYLKDEDNNRYIFYLVTKKCSHWKPTMDTLTQSLQTMKSLCDKFQVKKLAMPRIGCGLDKLWWRDVRQAINEVFQNSNIHIAVYDFNVEGEPEGKSARDRRGDGVPARYNIMPLSTMDTETALLFFGTEDGYMDSTAKGLNGRFNFENDYKKTPKTVGSVFCYKKCPKNQYYIYGLIVAKTFGPVSFVNIESCCKELVKMLRSDEWPYVGMEAFVQWSEDDTFTEKVVNLLKHSVPSKIVKELWVCFQQPEHDTLNMCHKVPPKGHENNTKKSPDNKV